MVDHEEEDKVVVRNLSKNVLGLKFMKRKAAADAQKSMDESKQREVDAEHWVLDHDTFIERTNIVECDVSILICENLSRCGRRSFRNFNPHIEKLYKEMKAERDQETYNEGGDDQDTNDVATNSLAITDEEMAERYGTLVQSMNKKFNRKRKSHPLDQHDQGVSTVDHRSKANKRKFLKPDS
ncbi:M-phase phosphoprotein 6-like [Corticium candelabrum]|uniref:M-phase phosphoprotein 6-like n=1 Tax=Corticium candelabrum TaxID=121492 RepID=UPI002E25CA35|nr:M-phase phosphoprotein 6-like [Corticium candelabrum]